MDHSVPDKNGKVHEQFLDSVDRHIAKNLNKCENDGFIQNSNCVLFRIGLLRVTHVDIGHSVRGSWGDTRAMHLTMEDDVRIKMNMVNVNDYLSLQAEAGYNTLLIKKVGRVFSGPTESMAKMHDLMSGQELFTNTASLCILEMSSDESF